MAWKYQTMVWEEIRFKESWQAPWSSLLLYLQSLSYYYALRPLSISPCYVIFKVIWKSIAAIRWIKGQFLLGKAMAVVLISKRNRIEELLKKQAKKRIEKNKKADQYNHHHHQKKSSKKDDIEMESLPQPTLPKVDMNSLSVNNYYPHQQAPRQHYQHHHQQQPSFTGSVNNNPGRPNYYPQASSSNSSTVMGSQFTRRNSLSSVGSDQVGLTSHAQGQPWSSTPYYHSNGSHNGSSSNLSYSIQHQQYQQPYQQFNNYQQHHQNYY